MKRRELLALAARAGLGAAALSAVPATLRSAFAADAGPPLLERNLWPRQWETAIAALDRAELTPNDLFFVRCHLPAPEIKPADWRLRVSGNVVKEVSLSLADLRAMPQHEVTCVIECAGNGRGLFRLPNTSGTQWEYGAVGNARWRGVRLADVLERAGASDDAPHLWMEAADRSPFGKVPPFVRSLPGDKARADVLLALEMNGTPIPPLHGGPCRAVVPGWYGMASTKWLTGVRVQKIPSPNHFMARGYRYTYPGEAPNQAAPVEDMRVKSLVTSVREAQVVEPGTVVVGGWTWGGREVTRVDVSTDEMATWNPASLGRSAGPHAWRRWERAIPIAPGATVSVAARATDESGEQQPVAARVNSGGYANNSIHQVTFRARG